MFARVTADPEARRLARKLDYLTVKGSVKSCTQELRESKKGNDRLLAANPSMSVEDAGENAAAFGPVVTQLQVRCFWQRFFLIYVGCLCSGAEHEWSRVFTVATPNADRDILWRTCGHGTFLTL
jgi:hypothetical protein